jgi:hypothetical protein
MMWKKKRSLCDHIEKLDIALGLINATPGTPLQIVKNLQVCGDCHTATKFISNSSEINHGEGCTSLSSF